MEIRPYQASDEGSVVALWRGVFPAAPAWNDPRLDIRRKLAVQPELFLVAVRDEALVGTVMAGFDGHRGWLYYLAVSPRARREGVGRRLVEQAEQRLLAVSCVKVNLQVRAGSDEAERFWERLGYGREARVSFGMRLPE
ncbi:MAG TPA: GNAT family acetyltransferase [Thermoanaerobaculia bacterium]|nr:GNAT family acetyltransferase [Thermoanaerobaculia bacterium]